MTQATTTVSDQTANTDTKVLKKKRSRKKVAKSASKTAAKSAAKKAKTKKKVDLSPCACGCGAMVPRSYQQGHDARHKGQLLDIATGQKIKTPLRTPAELKEMGYTDKMIKDKHIVTTNTTPKQAHAAIKALGWSHFLDQREAKIEAKEAKKKR